MATITTPSYNNYDLSSFIKNTQNTGKINPVEYQRAKAEFAKSNPNVNFDKKVEEALSGVADKNLSQKLISEAKKISAIPSAKTEISFIDTAFSGDITIKDNGGEINNGNFKINLTNPTSQKAFKELDPGIKEIKYSEKNGEGKYTINHGNTMTGDFLPVAIDVKADKDGRLYMEPANGMASFFNGTIVDKVQKNLESSLGIKLKADYQTEKRTIGGVFGIKKREIETVTGRVYLTPESVKTKLGSNEKPTDISADIKNAKFKVTPQGIEADFSANNVKVSSGEPVKKPEPKTNLIIETDAMGGVTGTREEVIQPEETKYPNMRFNLERVSAKFETQKPEEVKGFIKNIQGILKNEGVNAEKVKDLLKSSGLPENIITSITSLDDKGIDNLLKNPDISDKIKKISLNLNLNNVTINSNEKDTKISSQNPSDSKTSAISAKADVEVERKLNFGLVERLKNDLSDKTKVENIKKNSGLNPDELKSLDKIKNEADLNKVSPELKTKLNSVINTLYSKELSGSFNVGNLDSTIKGDKITGNVSDTSANLAVSSGDASSNFNVSAKEINVNDEKITGKDIKTGLKAENIKLNEEQIKVLKTSLDTAKNAITQQLEKVGLNEKQFVAISNAVTRLGTQAGSMQNQIQNIAKASGGTPQQVKDLMNLFSNKDFNNALSDFSNISNSLKNGRFTLNANVSAKDIDISSSDKLFLASANNLSTKVNFSSKDGLNVNAENITAKNVTVKNTTEKTTVSAEGLKTNNILVQGGKGKIEGNVNSSNLNFERDKNTGNFSLSSSRASIHAQGNSGINFNANARKASLDSDKNKLELEKVSTDAKIRGTMAKVEADKITAQNTNVSANNTKLSASINRNENDTKGTGTLNLNAQKITSSKNNGLTTSGIKGDVEIDLKSPIASIKGSSDINVGDLNIKPNGDTNIKGLSFNRTTGNASISYGKLSKILSNDPQGKKILANIKEKGIHIPEDQKLNFRVDQGALKDGKLSGNISLANFDFGLGKADISLKIDSFDPASDKGKISSNGNLKIKLDPEKTANFLSSKIKGALPDSQVKMVDGQITTKFNTYMTDGSVRVYVENNEVKMNIDKAKFLNLINVKDTAKDKLEKLIKEMGVETSSDGKNVKIGVGSLNKYLNKNVLSGLNISGISDARNNNFNVGFSFSK